MRINFKLSSNRVRDRTSHQLDRRIYRSVKEMVVYRHSYPVTMQFVTVNLIESAIEQYDFSGTLQPTGHIRRETDVNHYQRCCGTVS